MVPIRWQAFVLLVAGIPYNRPFSPVAAVSLEEVAENLMENPIVDFVFDTPALNGAITRAAFIDSFIDNNEILDWTLWAGSLVHSSISSVRRLVKTWKQCNITRFSLKWTNRFGKLRSKWIQIKRLVKVGAKIKTALKYIVRSGLIIWDFVSAVSRKIAGESIVELCVRVKKGYKVLAKFNLANKTKVLARYLTKAARLVSWKALHIFLDNVPDYLREYTASFMSAVHKNFWKGSFIKSIQSLLLAKDAFMSTILDYGIPFLLRRSLGFISVLFPFVWAGYTTVCTLYGDPIPLLGQILSKAPFVRDLFEKPIAALYNWIVGYIVEKLGLFEFVWQNGGQKAVSFLNGLLLRGAEWVFEHYTGASPADDLKAFMEGIPTKMWRAFVSEEVEETIKSNLVPIFETLISFLQEFRTRFWGFSRVRKEPLLVTMAEAHVSPEVSKMLEGGETFDSCVVENSCPMRLS